MNKSESGNVPHKRMNRWSTPKRYGCTHTGCQNAAVICSPHSRLETEGAHNCCKAHDHNANTDMVMAIVDKIMVRDAHILQRLAEIEAAE